MTKLCRDNQIERMDTITKAIQIMKDWHSYGSREKTVDLLTQIQQIVITVGTVIEQDLQDYHLLVTELEELGELIYQISISLEDYKSIHLLVNEAESKMKHLRYGICAISPKKEVVFLPYQVSMWDSLESVWLESKEDTEVESYVVPIPYYDVLPDNSLGKLHDQGTDYPDYVPITSYQNYSLEERRPDVIFFHNPYDECNLVTRVPERYYSSQLKKYTDQLVYIPYFISPLGGPSEHQCFMPGVLFADKVIVQPESVYETYCRVYTKTLKMNGWEKILAPAKEKFLPLGTPKIDKLMDVKCEIDDLPEIWKRVILKPDGRRKKVVLYNLTINALLVNNEQEIKKIDNVFKIFKERQEEIALLWRPHPLLLSTICSMRPQLGEAYLKCVREFQEQGWGIYDDSSDATLAIALSDAYYGDWSSLLVLYEATGKFMQVQNVWLSEENDFLARVLDNSSKQGHSMYLANNEERKIGSSIYHLIISGK